VPAYIHTGGLNGYTALNFVYVYVDEVHEWAYGEVHFDHVTRQSDILICMMENIRSVFQPNNYLCLLVKVIDFIMIIF